MRVIFLFFTIFSAALSYAQTDALVLKSFVRKDTVLLRWSPVNADLMMQGLRNGYVVQRINGSGTFENNSSLTETVIAPFSDRKASYENSVDHDLKNTAEFVADLLAVTSPAKESVNMAFAVLSLGASTNRELAFLLGLYYEDIRPADGTYTYRILLKNSAFKSNTSTLSTTSLSQHANLSTLSGSAAQPKLKQVYLSWEALSLQDDYAAYHVERSEDSIHFSALNKLPYYFLKSASEPDKTQCDFADTTVREARTYYYRITGISHFAETGHSSNMVKVYVPRFLTGETRIDSIAATGTERHIYTRFGSGKKNNDPDKMIVLRSDSLLFGYTVIAEEKFPVNYSYSFKFITTVPLESGDRYYYKAATIGSEGDTLFSNPFYFFTLDQIPPHVPTELQGAITDSGIVHLSWKPNADKDLRGYRVYRSNALNEEFVEVTRSFCTDAVFTDTLLLNNLSPDVYYRISAVDLNYNNSDLSKPLKLLKPDTIAPVPAVFKTYEVTISGVLLQWVNSTSKDVKTQMLIRQDNQRTDTLAKWDSDVTYWKDSTGINGKSYQYSIVTIDESNNRSLSANLAINYETGIRQGVQELNGTANRTKQCIELSWILTETEIYSIQIYRAKNDGNFVLYKTLRDHKTTWFADENLSINNVYHYKVKVIYKSGASSGFSEVLSVTY